MGGEAHLIDVRMSKKPTEMEIITDVPLALKVMSKGITWLIAVLGELRNRKFVEKSSNITVFPRFSSVW